MILSNKEIKNISKKHGVITLWFNDQFTKIINDIINKDESLADAIGIYTTNEKKETYVYLYNTYDNHHLGYLNSTPIKLNQLLKLKNIIKVIFYPIIKKNNTIIDVESLTNNNSDNRIYKIEKIINKHVDKNNKSLDDKYNIYYNYICKLNNLSYNYKFINGFDIINNILSDLMCKNKIYKESKNIIYFPYLDSPHTIVSENIDMMTIFKNDYVKAQLNIIHSVYADLLTSNDDFIYKYFSKKSNRELTNNNYMNYEYELIDYLIKGFNNGKLYLVDMNNYLSKLNKLRLENGEPILPLALNPPKNVYIMNNFTPKTYDNEIDIGADNDIKNLGCYLQHLVDNYYDNEVLIVNLSKIIRFYNNSIKNTKHIPVIIPSTDITSKIGAFVLSNNDVIMVPKLTNNMVTMYNNNLSLFTNEQLIHILIYIDSLRNKDGLTNNKFNNLKNEIIQEINTRDK